MKLHTKFHEHIIRTEIVVNDFVHPKYKKNMKISIISLYRHKNKTQYISLMLSGP